MDSSTQDPEPKMKFSLSSKSKSQMNRLKKPSASDSSTKNYVTEFVPAEAPPPESKIKSISPIPNEWRPNKLKNLPNLPQISESNGDEFALQFELDPASNTESRDNSTSYGLTLRQPVSNPVDSGRGETISDLELRKFREHMERLPEDTGFDQFNDVPVEGFGAALLAGYGWKEGKGIGLNAKEDVKVAEIKKKTGRGGLGFTGELPQNHIDANGNGDKNVRSKTIRKEKVEDESVGKDVRILNGRAMGKLGKIVEVRHGGDLLVLKISKSNEMVKVSSRDVAEVGSAEEEKCLRKLKSKERSRDVDDRKDKEVNQKRGRKRVDWLRNHIRVRVISEKLKGGRLFLKKGVVVDVVGPGICDISMDGSRELIQGVEQESLETALPKRDGPVLVLYGKHKGVYGYLMERDVENEIGVVRDADNSHQLLNVKFEQIAEYTGDPSDIGY